MTHNMRQPHMRVKHEYAPQAIVVYAEIAQESGMENRLRILRKAQQLTQEDLAAAVGTDQATISRMEHADPLQPTVRKVCTFLSVPAADILGAEDNPHRLQNENETALLDIFRRLKPTNQVTALSRLHLLWRAQEGLITEAEMEPNLQGLLEPPAPRRPKRRKTRRTNPSPFENTE